MNDDMDKFAKLGSMLWRNGKARMLAREHPHAFAVWTFALSYCAHLLNDGMLTDFDLRGILGASDDDIDALIEARMLERHDDGTLWVHDFVQAQGRSRADVESMKERRAEAGRRGGTKSAASRSKQNEAPLKQNEATVKQNEANAKQTEAPVKQTSSTPEANRSNGQAPVKQTEANVKQTEANVNPDTDTDRKKENASCFPKKNRKTRIRPTFQPDKAGYDLAKSLGLDPNRERNRFVDHWLATGGTQADWQAAFRGWCENSPRAKQPAPPEPSSPPSDAWTDAHVMRLLPDGADTFNAKRRLLALIGDGMSWDDAADVVVSEVP